ncbi:hemolysin III family protein [[Clostridium] cellulosi]
MALNKIELHKYSLAEELINAISHGIGAALAIAALVVATVFSALHNNAWCTVSVVIYCSTLILLYLNSTIYHSLRPNAGKKVMRVLDHCTIYLLIAGTYTPFTLVPLRGALGWTLFGIVWGAAALGITLTAVNLKKFAKFSMICYIIMGWAIIVAIKPLISRMAMPGLLLLLAGGILYTIGAVLYLIGRRKKFIHSVWHFFVVGGSILHYFSILFYIVLAKPV